MSFIPRSGSLEQALRYLKAMALSSAYTTEVQAVLAVNATPLSFMMVDANGSQSSLQLADDPLQPDAQWVPTAFAQVVITEGLRPQAPFPRLELIGTRGTVQHASLGTDYAFDQNTVRAWNYIVDAVVVDAQSKAEDAERSALLLCDAFERLVMRNNSIVNPAGALGGLVEALVSEGPPVSGTGPNGPDGTIGGAMVRFHFMALRAI